MFLSTGQTGNGRGLVQVLNISTGIYPRGGACKMGGRVLSLAFEASGQMLWAGNDKVSTLPTHKVILSAYIVSTITTTNNKGALLQLIIST